MQDYRPPLVILRQKAFHRQRRNDAVERIWLIHGRHFCRAYWAALERIAASQTPYGARTAFEPLLLEANRLAQSRSLPESLRSLSAFFLSPAWTGVALIVTATAATAATAPTIPSPVEASSERRLTFFTDKISSSLNVFGVASF
jgi:hypothetical protein